MSLFREAVLARVYKLYEGDRRNGLGSIGLRRGIGMP